MAHAGLFGWDLPRLSLGGESIRDRIEIKDETSSEEQPKHPGESPERSSASVVLTGECTRNGIKVLPQPTVDPLDPLNWKKWEKNTILGIVMFNYFLLTYATSVSIPAFQYVQEAFNLSFDEVNKGLSLGALGWIVGPITLTSLADIYGRRIVQVISTAIALVATIGVATSATFPGYLISRFFQGYGASPAMTVGMGAGLLVDSLGVNWDSWVSAILFAVLLLLQLFFMPETLYPRNFMLCRMPKIGETAAIDQEKAAPYAITIDEVTLKRTKDLPFLNFRPVPGLEHPKVWDTMLRFFLTFRLYVVVIACVVVSTLVYSWEIAVLTCFPLAYGDESAATQALLYLGLLVGTVASEILCSGRLSDWIVTVLAKRNNHIRVPESRIWIMYPALLATGAGLALWGMSIGRKSHWIVGQVALFLCKVSVSIFQHFLEMTDGFFISPWIKASGWTWTFAAQGIMVAGAVVPVFAALHKYGARLRAMSPLPSWVNPEYDTPN
ncbi:predicted protein [Uncinocarpus reesii 1704]|uniref:Major facilitator superfamily (MFS) profile domain-containing protein n=1 Tax=Uncinocarpus reesii (strain UAMH 1704) TaxID=336963 RepID=C4JQB4_UNCRE|nr:uncharacterized protein UREG_04668 [Uncinocarpus reesii 1704]EEP79822.1 predicted protein [Uncinocarpus reesii 1704]